MKLPPIDLSKLVQLLKKEGGAELSAAAPSPRLLELTARVPDPAVAAAKASSKSALIREWDNIIMVLEMEVVPLLSKGCEAKSLAAPAQKLLKSAGSLSLMASQVLSFVPGPVGIVCSLVNAICCFSTGNVVGGLFELLGCIPGGKVAGKSASKLFPKVEKLLAEMVQNNYRLAVVVESSTLKYKAVTEFFAKHAPRLPELKPEVGYGYGVRTPAMKQTSDLETVLGRQVFQAEMEIRRGMGKYTTMSNTYGNITKTNLWPKLGY